MIELSKFFTENNKYECVVYLFDKTFRVTLKDEFGVIYSSNFSKQEDAENFCEDWILKHE